MLYALCILLGFASGAVYMWIRLSRECAECDRNHREYCEGYYREVK